MLTRRIIGVLELAGRYLYGFTSRGIPLYLFRPYDDSLPEFIVGSSERNTSVNQIAIVEIPVHGPARPGGEKMRGILHQLLGPVGDYTAEHLGLIEHYCPARHPRTPLIPEPDTSLDELREYLDAAHGWTTFHVDPEGCLDIDDAMAWNPLTATWAITIADVAAAVPPDCAIDQTAAAIGATFYMLSGAVLRPMLPRALSESATSLLPGQIRRGLTLFLGPDGASRWAPTWITVENSFTYDNFAASAIGATRGEPHQWIADQMILYNKAAAALLKQHGIGLLRTQAPADADAAANWDTIDPALVRLAHETARYEVADANANMEQVHAGLGGQPYAHATSPLRRYADLVNQRALKALLFASATASTAMAAELNDRQRANRRWTRDLTFLENVTPGKVHTIDIIWVDIMQVWVPAWSRLLRLRHVVERPPAPGTKAQIDIFCDPTQRNWKQRVMTSSSSSSSSN